MVCLCFKVSFLIQNGLRQVAGGGGQFWALPTAVVCTTGGLHHLPLRYQLLHSGPQLTFFAIFAIFSLHVMAKNRVSGATLFNISGSGKMSASVPTFMDICYFHQNLTSS